MDGEKEDQWSWRVMLADVQDRLAAERDPEVEEAILGCLIIDPQVTDLVAAKLRGTDFWDKDLGAAFDAMVTLHELKKPINDPKVLLDGLKSFGLTTGKYAIKRATIAKWLSHVSVQTGLNAMYYAESIIKLSQARMQLQAVTKSIDDLVEGRVDPSQSADRLMGRLETISMRTSIDLVEFGDSIVESVEAALKAQKEKKIGGCTTGLRTLDEMLGGLHRKELIVIAARPSAGKTALGMQICYAVASRGERVLFISIEMSHEELTLRLACAFAGVDNQHLRSGSMTDLECQNLRKAAVELHTLPITIYEQKRATIRQIKAAIKQKLMSGPISLVCVDYLQRIHSTERGMIRAEHIAYCTSELKSMASDFDVPMVILCQLNRGAEDETPTLANLKESGAIEEDADVVIAIHHGVEIETEMVTDSVTKKKTKVEHKRQVDQLIVLKNRNGPRGTIDVKWTPAATRFEDKPDEPSF